MSGGQKQSMTGLFMLMTDDTGDGAPSNGGPMLARIEGQLYALAYSNVARAGIARVDLGVAEARFFYLCAANIQDVVKELRAAGAVGYIVDFEPQSEQFRRASLLPLDVESPVEPVGRTGRMGRSR